jgi:DNA recombination protein Rad52
MTGFTAEQIALLVKPLSAAHVKERPQAGRRLAYLEAWHVIAEANRIFGFDGWNREMMDCRCVAERETKIGQGTERQKDGWRVGYIARVRVTVGHIVREGCGYGSGIDQDLGAAHESALKEAESDAMKRALMTFGNQFGLALYDKAQSNVEAPARPPPRSTTSHETYGGPGAGRTTVANGPARPAAAPERPTSAAKSPGRSDTGERKLSELRDAIIAKLNAPGTAYSAERVDAVMRDHHEDLNLLRAHSIPTYDRLIALAEGRRQELTTAAARDARMPEEDQYVDHRT